MLATHIQSLSDTAFFFVRVTNSFLPRTSKCYSYIADGYPMNFPLFTFLAYKNSNKCGNFMFVLLFSFRVRLLSKCRLCSI